MHIKTKLTRCFITLRIRTPYDGMYTQERGNDFITILPSSEESIANKLFVKEREKAHISTT